jgi:hypothetical protein
MMNTLLIASCLCFQAQNANQAIGSDQKAPPSASEAAIAASISTIAENLQKADQGLAAGETGNETLAAQQKAIDELQKLIDAAKSNAQSSSAKSSASRATPQDASSDASPMNEESNTQQNPQGGTASGRSDKSATSDENAVPPARSGDAVLRFRASVVRDAWGHLPQRLRDQLLNTGSDKYLPKYDGLVRDYFESLAKPVPTRKAPDRD